MKIIVLGAGISGVTIARLLNNDYDVEVLEKEQKIGGLCSTEIINGYTYDLYGGHIFNSKTDFVREWVFSLFPQKYWHKSQRICKIDYNGLFINYPFELSIFQLPTEEAIDCILDFLKEKSESPPSSLKDWFIWRFGESIATKYLLPYNEKIWKRDLKSLSATWTAGKMPLIDKRDFLKSVLTRNSKENTMPHSEYYYPLYGGIQTLIDKIADGIKVRTKYPVENIEQKSNQWIINGEITADKIISTIPLPELSKVCKFIPSKIKHAISQLQYNPVTTTLFPAERNILSWVYYPGKHRVSHRLVYIGNFSPNNAPSGRGSVIAEATMKVDPIIQARDFEFKNVIASSYAEYAYPIFDVNYEMNIKLIKEYFHSVDITLLGRFAEWKYYNMDVCIKRAFEVKQEIEKIVKERRVER